MPFVREVPNPRERNASLADGLNPQRQARHYWGRAVPDPTAVSQRKRREFLPIPLEAIRMILNKNRVPTPFESAGKTQ